VRSSAPTPIGDTDIVDRAAELLGGHVGVSSLALAFAETTASSAEVHVEGRNFYPPMLHDLAAATSSIHVNQFGFRPGEIGEQFASALLAKAAEGIRVRLVVDRQGSDPERSSQAFYERLVRGGVEVYVVRAVKLRSRSGRLGAEGPMRWNLQQVGHIDHRKVVIVDGRTGWVGGAGVEDHFHDGRFHDMFVRVAGPVVSQLQLVFLATLRWLGGEVREEELDLLFPHHASGDSAVPAVVKHNAPGGFRPITDAIAALMERASGTLDVVNPYVTDRRMIGRMTSAARRGVRVRLFVPADANNWACAAAQRFHHRALVDAGVEILEYPTMLHAKAFVRDGDDVLVGTCNLEAWSLRRFFEIDVLVRSSGLAEQFEARFAAPAVAVSRPGTVVAGARNRLRCAAFAAISPLL
jgi:cardiolipin synthase